jgi:hypothetical protein
VSQNSRGYQQGQLVVLLLGRGLFSQREVLLVCCQRRHSCMSMIGRIQQALVLLLLQHSWPQQGDGDDAVLSTA